MQDSLHHTEISASSAETSTTTTTTTTTTTSSHVITLCNDNRCKLCKLYLQAVSSFKIAKNVTWNIKCDISCQSKNVVYFLSCNSWAYLYVFSIFPSSPLSRRFSIFSLLPFAFLIILIMAYLIFNSKAHFGQRAPSMGRVRNHGGANERKRRQLKTPMTD